MHKRAVLEISQWCHKGHLSHCSNFESLKKKTVVVEILKWQETVNGGMKFLIQFLDLKKNIWKLLLYFYITCYLYFTFHQLDIYYFVMRSRVTSGRWGLTGENLFSTTCQVICGLMNGRNVWVQLFGWRAGFPLGLVSAEEACFPSACAASPGCSLKDRRPFLSASCCKPANLPEASSVPAATGSGPQYQTRALSSM